MNREQRRKIQKKADKVWKLEMLATMSDEKTKATLENEIKKIMSTCSLEELLLIDEYIIEKHDIPT